MILHPIIDLLKRIVVALPDYGGGGCDVKVDSGEFILASDLGAENFHVDHNLGDIPNAIEWWIDSETMPTDTNSLWAGYYSKILKDRIDYNILGSSQYVYGIWYGTPTATANYQEVTYSSTSPYIAGVTTTGFNIRGGTYSIPSGYTIKWRAYSWR